MGVRAVITKALCALALLVLLAELVQKQREGSPGPLEWIELTNIIRQAASNPRPASRVLEGVDVTFSQRRFFNTDASGTVISIEHSPDVPTGGTRFNTCLPDKGPSKDNADLGYFAYATAVHEAGHALGLSNFSYDDLVLSSGDQPYEAAHPTIPDAVLNYDDDVPEDWARWAPSPLNEPDCSPHPFDVMAVYALYQNVPGP